MPFKSDSQRKLFYAAAAGKSDKIKPEVAKEFIEKTPKAKFSKLKEYVSKKGKKD